MKVNIYETVQVSDVQRQQIADLVDEEVNRRKATRDEMKQFIWANGEDWDVVLDERHDALFGEDEDEDDLIGDAADPFDPGADLIGDVDDPEGLL